MQFSSLEATTEATTGFCSRSSFRYSGSPSQPKWFSALLLLAQTGAAILVILAFQQFLLRLYTACWQMAMLFALIGLMVALLLGQFRLGNSRAAIRWTICSSFVVTLLGLGVAVCILTANPPIT